MYVCIPSIFTGKYDISPKSLNTSHKAFVIFLYFFVILLSSQFFAVIESTCMNVNACMYKHMSTYIYLCMYVCMYVRIYFYLLRHDPKHSQSRHCSLTGVHLHTGPSDSNRLAQYRNLRKNDNDNDDYDDIEQVPLVSVERVELEERRGRLTLLVVSR